VLGRDISKNTTIIIPSLDDKELKDKLNSEQEKLLMLRFCVELINI